MLDTHARGNTRRNTLGSVCRPNGYSLELSGTGKWANIRRRHLVSTAFEFASSQTTRICLCSHTHRLVCWLHWTQTDGWMDSAWQQWGNVFNPLTCEPETCSFIWPTHGWTRAQRPGPGTSSCEWPIISVISFRVPFMKTASRILEQHQHGRESKSLWIKFQVSVFFLWSAMKTQV